MSREVAPRPPWEDIETVFLDVGNTLVSHDFDAIAALLAEHGLEIGAAALARAEAAARPALSRWLAGGRSTEGHDTLETYVELTLERLPGPTGAPAAESGRRRELAEALVPALRTRSLFFCRALPGTRDALERLRAAGPELYGVSNSDGTVENQLEALGLRAPLAGVVDSALVGHEKPDPGIFRHALERFGRDPARTLHVGDLFDVDVVGARAAGLAAALVDPYDDWSDADCLRVRDVGHLAELVAAARGPRRVP